MYSKTVCFTFRDLPHIRLTVMVPCMQLTSDDIIIEHAHRMLSGKLSIVDENIEAVVI